MEYGKVIMFIILNLISLSLQITKWGGERTIILDMEYGKVIMFIILNLISLFRLLSGVMLGIGL